MLTNINGIDINYEVFGEGTETLLILHGWMGAIATTAPIWRYFMQSIKVVVIDFPGQGGKSGMLTESWGVPEYSEMVKSFMEELNIVKPHVIGHSFGGRVIIYLASKYPDIFDKIILTDAAGIKKKLSLKTWAKIKLFKTAKFFLKIITPKEKYDEKLNKLRKKFGSSDYSAISSNVIRETFNKVVNLDLEKNLKDIKRPTLLIWGENDKDTPLYMAKIMERKIEDSGLVVLKDAGHYSYLDKCAEYNLIVENFLGGE